MKKKEKDKYKAILLSVLARHVGKSKSISMEQLHKEVFGSEPEDKYNSTRVLRKLVEELRREGVPICSSMQSTGGGYYIAAAGSELEAYLKNLRKRALKALMLEAKLRNMALPKLIGQIQLNLGGYNESKQGS